MRRFITEYANYKIHDYKSNELMQDRYKTEKIDKINKALRFADRGMITVDETIKLINEA